MRRIHSAQSSLVKHREESHAERRGDEGGGGRRGGAGRKEEKGDKEEKKTKRKRKEEEEEEEEEGSEGGTSLQDNAIALTRLRGDYIDIVLLTDPPCKGVEPSRVFQ